MNAGEFFWTLYLTIIACGLAAHLGEVWGQ